MNNDTDNATAKQPYLAILEHFGVTRSDCSFDMLKECTCKYKADLPDKQVRRWHAPIIQELVHPGDSLIDLGCGDGELLARLSYGCECWIQGVESNEKLVNRCIERGVPVCHADLADVIDLIPDNNYTWAILEDTLQTLEHPLDVLTKMLRIARHSIVSFPNFAHWSVRFTFSLGGRMPITKSLPNTWYNTPNIHLCSITDFLDWVAETGVRIENGWVLVEGEVVPFNPVFRHNITGEQALFVISR